MNNLSKLVTRSVYRSSFLRNGLVSRSSQSFLINSSINNNSNHSIRSFATGNVNKVLFDDEKFYHEEKYHGISKEPFGKEVTDILMGDLNNSDIEIKPDGLLYLPEIKYRRILNQAFGPGGWALKPMGPPMVENGSLIRPYALYCLGRYISESIGEQPYSESGYISFATATEAAKSNALVRCCKDLGIGSSLWDPNFIRVWKQTYAVEKFYENAKTKERKKLWTLKSNPSIGYPWKEMNGPVSESVIPAQETIAYQGQEEVNTSSNQQQQHAQQQQQQQHSQQQQQQSYGEEEIDVDSVVPPQFKKYSGKTWRDVINDPKGIQYIQWASQNFQGKVQMQAKAISDWIEQNSHN